MMYEALRKGATVEEIHQITKVKHWFIQQMLELVQEEEELLLHKGQVPNDAALLSAKKNGFSDKYLSKLLEIPEDAIRQRRMELDIQENWEPVHVSGTQDKAYYYSTYNGTDRNPIRNEKPKVMILGGGKISYYLAKILAPTGVQVSIIEESRQAARELADADSADAAAGGMVMEHALSGAFHSLLATKLMALDGTAAEETQA